MGRTLTRAALVLALASAAAAQAPSSWVVGGQRGDSWDGAALRWIALDDTTRPGAVQLQELPAGINLLRERVRSSAVTPRNIFLYKWSFNRGRLGMEGDTLHLGWHPRLWQGGAAEATGIRSLVDGDELTPSFTNSQPAADRPSAVVWFTLDLGVPLPIDSASFFPPQNGLTAAGLRLRDQYPQAYEVSRAEQPVEWLLYEDETSSTGSSRYHPLDEVLASTFSNNQSVVALSFPLRFTRFLRFRFGGVKSTDILSEIKAFGRGFPAEGRYLSRPHAFGQPVSFGQVTWHFTRYRLVGGQVVEDPAAPVAFVLRTRSGTDDDPQAYYIFDELGRQVEVDRDTYYGVEPPKTSVDDGLPNFRAALTEDVGNWNAWSIAYPQSGDEIRSSDGRQFFQFSFTITTADPMAFGVLDSLSFQTAPLLADSVLAEVSLDGLPEPPGGRIEVPLGVDTVFVYDLRVASRGAGQGFDAVELDVPANTRFLGLEIAGAPAAEGEDFELLPSAADRLAFAFPRPFIAGASLRVRFRSALFHSSAFFGGNILNRDPAAQSLPQSIEAGDARPEVKSDRIQVVATQLDLRVLGQVRLLPALFTPNGDGANDQTLVELPVFGVEQARIEVEVWDLSGRRVARIAALDGGAGRYQPRWAGRDDQGNLVPPGLYLVKVRVAVDEGDFTSLHPVAVVY
jgi:hypothetical protein